MFLSNEELKELSKRNNLIVFKDILLNWLLIVGSYSIYAYTGSYLAFAFSCLVIATRIHALMIIAHDCSHNLFLKNRVISDFISTLLCSVTSGMITNRYRSQHLDHHKFLQTQKDPFWVSMRKMNGWTYPKSKKEIYKVLVKDLLGLSISEHKTALLPWSFLPKVLIKDKKVPTLKKYEVLAVFLFLFSIVAIPVFLNQEAFILAYALGMSLLPFITRVRAITEHYPLEKISTSEAAELFHTFTVSANLLERFLIAPHNICRHLEHHLYPTIPYYNLEKAHQILKRKDNYARRMFELDGYFTGERNTFSTLSKYLDYPQEEPIAVNL